MSVRILVNTGGVAFLAPAGKVNVVEQLRVTKLVTMCASLNLVFRVNG